VSSKQRKYAGAPTRPAVLVWAVLTFFVLAMPVIVGWIVFSPRYLSLLERAASALLLAALLMAVSLATDGRTKSSGILFVFGCWSAAVAALLIARNDPPWTVWLVAGWFLMSSAMLDDTTM